MNALQLVIDATSYNRI